MENITTGEFKELSNNILNQIKQMDFDLDNTKDKTAKMPISAYSTNITHNVSSEQINKPEPVNNSKNDDKSKNDNHDTKDLHSYTALSDMMIAAQATPTSAKQKGDASIKVYKQVWKDIAAKWTTIYKLILEGNQKSIVELNDILDVNYIKIDDTLRSLSKFLQFSATFGRINNQILPGSENYVELYISPNGNKDYIKYMNSLYDTRAHLSNCHIFKYHPYHPQDDLISNIEFADFTVKYDDFGYYGEQGFDAETKMPVMNLVIVVNKTIAKHIIEETSVKFKNKDQITERNVYLQYGYNVVDKFLLNVLGEYHLLNHTGYIEILPSDHSLIMKNADDINYQQHEKKQKIHKEIEESNKSTQEPSAQETKTTQEPPAQEIPAEEEPLVFTELVDAKKSMQLINGQYEYNYCVYCSRHQLQGNLYVCGRCKKPHYCSKFCQRNHYKIHKKNCSAPAS